MKVFQINAVLATEVRSNTNVIKTNINSLLSMGKTCMVINSVLNPILPGNDPIKSFLWNKISHRFYDCELLVLVKENNFPSGEAITGSSLQKKLTDAIPCLCDKKSGENFGIQVLSCKCKKL